MSSDWLSISYLAEVTTDGAKPWVVKMLDVGGEKCVMIDPRDRALVHLVAGRCDVKLDAADLKRNPSLKHIAGYVDLFERRNTAQAIELTTDGDAPRRRLFESPDSEQKQSKAKRTRVTRVEMADMRSNPELFNVKLDDDTSVMLQRPIHQTDRLVVKLDADNVAAFIDFMVNSGVQKDDFFCARRYNIDAMGTYTYKAHGKAYAYRKSDDGLQRIAEPQALGDVELDEGELSADGVHEDD